MKIRQVLILKESDCDNAFYSFQTYVNDNLARFFKDEKKSDVKLEFVSSDTVVISYLINIPANEIDTF